MCGGGDAGGTDQNVFKKILVIIFILSQVLLSKGLVAWQVLQYAL